jgi:TonB family protein
VLERATRWPLWGLAGGIFLCLSIAATGLVAAPNDAARPKAPSAAAPPASPPKDGAAAGSADWPRQVLDRIVLNRKFPADVYCREGVVKILFVIDRAGQLLSSEVTESSSVPAFDAEALAIVKRAHPFPPPPDGIGGSFVTLTVPIRFRPESPGANDERRLYLNVKSDLTLTLDGVPVQGKELDRTIGMAASNDKNAWIVICGEENVPVEELSNLAEQVKAAGFKFTVLPPR